MNKAYRFLSLIVGAVLAVGCSQNRLPVSTSKTSSQVQASINTSGIFNGTQPTTGLGVGAPPPLSQTYSTPDGSPCRTDLITDMNIQTLPINLTCATINRMFVGQIDYPGADGKCYRTNWTGTAEIACSPVMKLPMLPNGQLPMPYDSNFNWVAANAVCYYTQGDTAGAPYGGTWPMICGMGRGDAGHVAVIINIKNPLLGTSIIPNPGTPDPVPAIVPTPIPNIPSLPNPPVISSTPSSSGGPGVSIDYNNGYIKSVSGSPVGPRIGLPPATGCNQSIFSSAVEILGRFPADVACNTINKAFIASYSYKGSDGKCYQADLTGTYEIYCTANLPVLPVTTSLPFNLLPDPYDGSHNWWSGSNAVCWYTAGDIGSPGIYGVPYQMICGGYHSPPPIPEDSVINHDGYHQSVSGSPVGPRIGLPAPTGCNQSVFAAALELLGSFPADVACNTINKAYVASFSYKGSDGRCYQADLTGTYVITCTVNLPSLPATTSLPFNLLPDPYDGSHNWWTASNAVCWYTAGDIGAGGVYGVPFQMICGSFHSPPPL